MKYAVAFSLALSLFAWRVFTLIPGPDDPYYSRFTKGNFQGLVIGSSRAAQGIVPSQLGEGIYNFSFNSVISPYGPSYSRAILKKLSPDARGPFIIEVNPSQLVNSGLRERKDVYDFPEDGGPLDRMFFFNLDPNPEYVLRFRLLPYYRSPSSAPLRLHSDGWLETLPSAGNRMGRKAAIVRSYEDHFRTQALSEKRLIEFRRIVETLKARGPVLLVRLPTSPEIAAVEEKYFPDFSVRKLADDLGVASLDLLRLPGVETTDGDHLTTATAETVTGLIRDAIRSRP